MGACLFGDTARGRTTDGEHNNRHDIASFPPVIPRATLRQLTQIAVNEPIAGSTLSTTPPATRAWPRGCHMPVRNGFGGWLNTSGQRALQAAWTASAARASSCLSAVWVGVDGACAAGTRPFKVSVPIPWSLPQVDAFDSPLSGDR